MNTITSTVLVVSLLASSALTAAALWSIAYPRRRVWPPPGGKVSWHFWLIWILFAVLVATMIILGVLDHGSLGLHHWGWRVSAILLLLAGNALAWWDVATLGTAATAGLTGSLVTHGPYRVSRNPQYLGDILVTAGFVLLANSPLTLWPAIVTILAALAAPYAEEPWLRQKLGPDYERYRRRVPRFVGWTRHQFA